jgi:CheY-like chemotaxis protein
MRESDAEPIKVAGTVLVVEDEVLIRLVIAEYLRDCGYRVFEAAHADEALLVLRRLELAIDVVFTDVEMPGSMDGFALAQWVRTNAPGVDVILAGSVNRAVQAASDLCDQQDHVPKPYDPQSVHDRIRRLLASRGPPKRDLDLQTALEQAHTNGAGSLS